MCHILANNTFYCKSLTGKGYFFFNIYLCIIVLCINILYRFLDDKWKLKLNVNEFLKEEK